MNYGPAKACHRADLSRRHIQDEELATRAVREMIAIWCPGEEGDVRARVRRTTVPPAPCSSGTLEITSPALGWASATSCSEQLAMSWPLAGGKKAALRKRSRAGCCGSISPIRSPIRYET